jgi:hypothetical protein
MIEIAVNGQVPTKLLNEVTRLLLITSEFITAAVLSVALNAKG